MVFLPYYPGDGTGPIMIEVSFLADYPRDKDWKCAFCHGDPCAESSAPESEISLYYARNKRSVQCPMCNGLPS